MFNHPLIRDAGGLDRAAGAGDGLFSGFIPHTVNGDVDHTITMAELMGGAYIRSGGIDTRTDTTPTAAQIFAANPAMNVGDSLVLYWSSDGSVVHVAGGVGVTMSSYKSTQSLTGMAILIFVKTSATTITCYVL